ncbi:MAG: hypothetical protein NC217_06070 [Muribaculaceae bacterium]|nr:hypothetical protein [Muribaculaceae bacterium]
MSPNFIKVKCPSCGATLRVQYIADPTGKTITCPICNVKNPLQMFAQVDSVGGNKGPQSANPQNNNSAGQHPGTGSNVDGHTELGGMTELGNRNNAICVLRDIRTNQVYTLRPGKNVIGRACTSSNATVRINTGDARQMSREHLDITVEHNPLTGYVHYVKLHKKEVNETRIEPTSKPGSPYPPQMTVLNFFDTFVLNPGDLIHLPDVTLRLEFLDQDDTILGGLNS